MATNVPVTLDTLIVVKLQFQGHNKKFKLPLRDLGANILPGKLRASLQVLPDEEVIFERYSDSAGAYVKLDSDKPQVYKTLFRAAKAKLKLRLRATMVGQEPEPEHTPVAPLIPVQDASSSVKGSSLHRLSSDTLTPQRAAPPAIARSPSPPRQPVAQEAPISPVSPLVPTKTEEAEAPVPQAFPAYGRYFPGLAARSADLAYRPKEVAPQCSWVVFCNNCQHPMEDEHFHCSICDHGDYDLCPSCVSAGIHCPGSGHWMVKRFVKNGCVVNSTTERVPPKVKPQTEQDMPGAFTEEKQTVSYEAEEPTRTCNCCVKVLSEKEFVTCTNCDDYDLCVDCHISNKHGHHPGHGFKPATAETTLTALADFLCHAGRNVRHSAVCDGCEKFIYGVRHKCLNCPDWDFCSECVKSSKYIHPGHRFVPIYEPLAEPITTGNRHYGIYCDGPLCKDKENQSYIEGVRYKCAVCHDTDFCANCEASPSNRHNHTHPLIKFKRPVRSVSVTTMGEDKNGVPIPRLGDQPARKSTATETNPVAPSTNAATQVQTIVDLKPSDEPQQKTTKEKIEIRDLLAEPVPEKIAVQDLLSAPTPVAKPAKSESRSADELDAHFVRDTITDGTKVFAGLPFVQVWTLRNPGPKAWPAGCSVRHIGGDNMLNLDNTRPLSQSELSEASETNVIGRSVEQGEEISFRVVMKAPAREGTAISYWRLKTADGTPFGHRLWCDIQVINPPSPVTSSPPKPAPVPASSSDSSETPNLTPYERFQQAKNYHARQRAMQSPPLQKKEVPDRTSRLQEEALERLRKMKLQMDEKDNQTRMAVKLEQEKMARIQKVRRAAVERLLENRRKEFEASITAAQQPKSPEAPKPVETEVKQETAELPVEEQSGAPKAKSAMIFPQLDKESPASSTHEAISTKSEPEEEIKTETEAETATETETATAAAPSERSDDDFFEDAESVEIRSIDSDDEGFMTDEEYDILDASDEELP